MAVSLQYRNKRLAFYTCANTLVKKLVSSINNLLQEDFKSLPVLVYNLLQV